MHSKLTRKRLVQRAHIVLLTAGGGRNSDITEELAG